MPRALAVTWDLVKSDKTPGVRKATLLDFDRVLGLGLASWQPKAEAIPDEITALVEKRQSARREKRFKDADALREAIRSRGYDVEDTPHGPRVKAARGGP